MDLSRYQEHYSLSHRLKRYSWYIVNRTLFRLMVTNAMKVPRNLLLRLFGGKHTACLPRLPQQQYLGAMESLRRGIRLHRP